MIDTSNGWTDGKTGRPATKLEWAKALAEGGFRVFPLHNPVFHGDGSVSCSCGDSECTHIGKHPRVSGYPEKATTDGKQIEKWWTRWPDANIGIRTGGDSRLFVIDEDGPEGKESMEHLQGELGYLPETLSVTTGREEGGRHYYFLAPEGCELHGTSGKIAPGIDTRALHNYVVAPGSVHETGKVYSWVDETVKLAELPIPWKDRLIELQGGEESRKVEKTEEVPGERTETLSKGKIPKGTRNATLTGLAGSYRQQNLSEGAALANLLEINRNGCLPPLPESEVKGIVKSVYRLYPAGQWSVSSYPYPLNDLGNARLMFDIFGEKILYCGELKSFFFWDGRRYRRCTESRIYQLAIDTSAILDQLARGIQDEALRCALQKHAKRSGSASAIRGMIDLFKNMPGTVRTPEDFNSDKGLLNLRNGTLDLRTQTLRLHDKKDLITLLAPADYDPQAECPLWQAFLDRIFSGDAGLIAYVQEKLGSCLMGGNPEQLFFIFHGEGSNGKSTLLDVIRSVLGDYSANTPVETILEKPFPSIPNDLARLAGKRLVTCTENDAGRRIAEGRIKELTGERSIMVRYMHSEFFEMDVDFKLFFSTNHRPLISDLGHGMWRRIDMIPFSVTIPEEEIDYRLGNKLVLEAPGILAWLVEGCMRWQARIEKNCQDSGKPQCVKNAIDDYKNEMDGIGSFIAERCEYEVDARSLFSATYEAYRSWCGSERIPVSKAAFSSRLKEKGYTIKAAGNSGSMTLFNLKLKDPLASSFQIEHPEGE